MTRVFAKDLRCCAARPRCRCRREIIRQTADTPPSHPAKHKIANFTAPLYTGLCFALARRVAPSPTNTNNICCGSFPHIRCLPRRSHRPSAALSPGLEPRGRCFSTTTESRSAHMTGRTRQLLRVHESMNFAKSSASLRPCLMRRQCSADSKNGPAPSS